MKKSGVAEHFYAKRTLDKYSDEELLDFFTSDCWKNCDKKVEVLQELENREAVRQKRTPAKIEKYKGEENGFYGEYDGTKNIIRINLEDEITVIDDSGGCQSKKLSSYDVLDSYYHESRHACQEKALIPDDLNIDKRSFEQIKIENKRDSKGNLYNFPRTTKEYKVLAKELDSNNYAASKMLDNYRSFYRDTEYKKYLKQKNDEFSELDKKLDSSVELRRETFLNNAERAKNKNDITSDYYADMKLRAFDSSEESVVTASRNTSSRLDYYSKNIESGQNKENGISR